MSIKSVVKHLSVIAPDLIVMENEKETASAEEAAEVHGVYVGQIVKTMVLIIEDPVLVMIAGDMKLDNKKYKSTFNKKAKMLSSEGTLKITCHIPGVGMDKYNEKQNKGQKLNEAFFLDHLPL